MAASLLAVIDAFGNFTTIDSTEADHDLDGVDDLASAILRCRCFKKVAIAGHTILDFDIVLERSGVW